MRLPLLRRGQLATLAAWLTVSELVGAQAAAPVNSAPSSTAPVPAPLPPAPSEPAAPPVAPAPVASASVAVAPVAAAPAPAPAVPAAAPVAPAVPVTTAASAPPAAPAAHVASSSERKRWPRVTRRQRAPKPVPEKPLFPLHSWLTLHAVANSVWNNDVAYDVFNDKDVGGRFGVQLDADLVQLTPAIALVAELGYTYEATDSSELPAGLGTGGKLEAHHPHVAALVRWSLVDWFAVHARAQVGLSFTELRIERGIISSPGDALSRDARNPFFGLGAGLSVMTPAHRISVRRQYFNSLAYGARVEAGYVFSAPIELAFPDTAAAPPERALAVRGADLGALNRSGPFLGLSAFVRF